MSATIEELDAARDVALRCCRSYSAFLLRAFTGRHVDGRRRPIREIREKLASDLHLLARLVVEARQKITPDVIDAVLVASGDGPPPTAESTWHELAVAVILRLVVDAECQSAISGTMDGACLDPLQFDSFEDADRLKDMILRCATDGIAALLEGHKPSRVEALGDVEAGINREWGAARKHAKPDGTPRYLGNGQIKCGYDTFDLEANQVAVLEALLDNGAMTLDKLRRTTLIEEPHKIIKTLQEGFPQLEPYLKRPGGRGRGGYRTTIIDGR